jgi:hypothetical protein
VENALVCSGKFCLPNKKTIQSSDTIFEVVLMDVNEQLSERPKKAKNGITVAKRSSYPKTQVFVDLKSAEFVAMVFG